MLELQRRFEEKLRLTSGSSSQPWDWMCLEECVVDGSGVALQSGEHERMQGHANMPSK